jgi:hypothetical protein
MLVVYGIYSSDQNIMGTGRQQIFMCFAILLLYMEKGEVSHFDVEQARPWL